MAAPKPLAPVQDITRAILVLRGQRVILDAELAALYGVTTKRLNEQVRRNRARFPEDCMFRLSAEEAQALRSQIATSKTPGRGGRRYLPYAFTEHGAIMAATVLNSARAIEVSLYIVRAFVQLRTLLATNRELARRFRSSRPASTRSSPSMTRPSLPSSQPSASSCIRRHRPRRGIGFTADLDPRK